MERILKTTAIAVALVFLAAISAFPLANYCSSPASHQETLNSIDDKISTVMTLTASSTALSAAITFLPDDAATPIAEKLADFSGYFLLILCVLYAEKYLLSIIGLAAFRVLIPVACGLGLISLYWRPHKFQLRQLAFRFTAFALAVYLAVPAGIWVSDSIYDTYRSSINETISAAQDFADDTSELTQTEDQGLISRILNGLSETITSMFNKVSNIVNRFVEAVAVMIVTSCVIPMLVLLFFLWLVRMLTGIDVFAARRKARPAAMED